MFDILDYRTEVRSPIPLGKLLQEARNRNLPLLVFVKQGSCCLSSKINDKRVTIETL